MSDLIENLEIGKAMAKISAHAVSDVCRVADKYGKNRNQLIERFAIVLALSIEASDFTNMSLKEEP